MQARLALGESAALAEAKPYWFNAEEQPASCLPLSDALATNGLLTVEDVWARLSLTLEAGNVSVAKHVARYFPGQQEIPLRELERAADNPLAFLDKLPVSLSTRAGRELTLFALSRAARSQPQQALPYWNALHARFSAEEQAYGWGQLAFHAARKHDPAALAWFGKAGRDSPFRLAARLEGTRGLARAELAGNIFRHRRHVGGGAEPGLLELLEGQAAPSRRRARWSKAMRSWHRYRRSLLITASLRPGSWVWWLVPRRDASRRETTRS